MTDEVMDQILTIRDSGETNMLDISNVLMIAEREGYTDLSDYIKEDHNRYFHFIITGEEV